MRRVFDWLFDAKHPLRPALVFLVIGLGNAYEAAYIHPNSLMSIVDWAFAACAFLGFILFLLKALSDFLY
jgi:hypothetical protein